MPIVSRSERARYLERYHPILHKFCIKDKVPPILEFRLNTELPFCYGRSEERSPLPASWDADDISVIPLWESGSSIVAIRSTDQIEEFVQICFEDANDILSIAKSEDGLLFYVFYFLIESTGGPGSDGFTHVQNLASELEFDRLDLVTESISRFSKDPDFDSFWNFTRSI